LRWLLCAFSEDDNALADGEKLAVAAGVLAPAAAAAVTLLDGELLLVDAVGVGAKGAGVEAMLGAPV
jgi:hypothetical protein